MINSAWMLSTEKNGISVFKRDFGGSQFQEFKVVADIDSRLSAFAALLLDVTSMPTWMHKTEEVKILEKISESERIAYMVLDLTPLPKRILVVRNKIIQKAQSKTVICSMEYMANYSFSSNSKRIQDLHGYIQAEPLDKNKIRVTYQTHVEPGIKLLNLTGVSSLVNKLISEIPYKTIANMRKELKKKQYGNASIGFIENP